MRMSNWVILVALMSLGQQLLAEGFPLRKKYPDLKTIETSELKSTYKDHPIVDVRSRFEFDVIRMNEAINIPVSKSSFYNKLIRASKSTDESIVFYCNGVTCAKSYKAAKIAQDKGFKNVKVYDAGIFAWAKAHNDLATLMGSTPVESSKLLSKDQFAKRTLEIEAFKKKVGESNVVLIDIRDPKQRQKTPDFSVSPEKLDLDRFAKKLEKGQLDKWKGKTLLIFDAVGKQVKWLQYHLEKNGFKSYYFLKDGVWSVFGAEGASKKS